MAQLVIFKGFISNFFRHIYSTVTLVILCHLFHSFLGLFLIFGHLDPPCHIFEFCWVNYRYLCVVPAGHLEFISGRRGVGGIFIQKGGAEFPALTRLTVYTASVSVGLSDCEDIILKMLYAL